MGWLIALGIVTLLAVLPLGVGVKYDADGFLVKIIAGPVKFTIFPRPQKKNSEKKPKPKKEKQSKQAEPVQEKSESASSQAEAPPKDPPKKKGGGSLTDFLPLVKTALDMLGTFRRRLRVNLLEVKLVMAADDPCDLAVNYGRAWAAIGNLLPQLEKIFVIKKRNIEVACDFEAAETKVTARLDLTITLGRILATVVVYGVRALVQFMIIQKKRKGGASK